MSDYISREAFLAEQRHLYCENCARRKGMKNGKMKFVYEIGDAPCRACDIGDVLDGVENFPAADVRPVRRGTWVGIDDYPHEDWECDNCGSVVEGTDDPWNYYHFCPNCGADMREES